MFHRQWIFIWRLITLDNFYGANINNISLNNIFFQDNFMELHFQEHINNKEMTFSKKSKKIIPTLLWVLSAFWQHFEMLKKSTKIN